MSQKKIADIHSSSGRVILSEAKDLVFVQESCTNWPERDLKSPAGHVILSVSEGSRDPARKILR